MGTFHLSSKSKERLVGVQPDLVKVVNLAIQITDVDFGISEGLRTRERQQQLFKSGATRTMNSRHLTGHAVDLVAFVNGEVRWDWPLYVKLAETMKKAASSLVIPLEWGGDWKTFKDGPHFQLPWVTPPR